MSVTVQPRAAKTAEWLRRIGITTAVTLGITLIAAAPAYAAPNDVRIVASGNVDLTVGGGTRRVVFTVSNAGPMDADNIRVRVDVPLGGEGVGVAAGPDGCEVGRNHVQCTINRLKRGDAEQFSVQIAPPQNGGPAPGETRSEQGVARAEVGEDTNPGNNAAAFRVTLGGPQAAKVVTEISGTVRDGESNKPVSGARVLVTDAKSQSHRTTTDDSGQFRLASADGDPIAAGALLIAVSKRGYETRKLRRTVDSGGSTTLRVSLNPKVAASASATGDPTASEEAAVTPTEAGEESDSGGWLIWMLYLFAALLVMGGIGAIVWLFVRRNEDDENEAYGPGRPGGPGGPGGGPGGFGGPGGPPGPGAPPIGAHGVYHDPYGSPTAVMGGGQPTRMLGADSPTSVLGPGGLSGAMDQPTSVIGPGGLSRGMDQPTSYLPRPGMDQPTSRIPSSGIDEPTQDHPGPLADDDDVYPHGRDVYADGTGRHGYGDPGYGRGQGYGDPGYRNDQGYGGQGSGGGYGAPPTSGGGYGTGPTSGGGYGAGPTSGSGGYGQGGGGYGQDPGYGARPTSGGGHHSAPPTSGGGYGAGPTPTPGGDYGQQGYDEQQYGEQQPRHGRRAAEDRRLDWYED